MARTARLTAPLPADVQPEYARSILIVDDDDDLRVALGDLLSFEGFTTVAVPNGKEALSWLKANPNAHCLVLLDIMMPVMDGRAFLRVQAADPKLCGIPVIVLTAAGNCRELIAYHGLEHCLPKMAPLPVLLAEIRSCG